MRLIRGLMPALVALTIGVACAQDPVVIGGMTVARIREKGKYESVSARVSQIDKWIADVISYEDTRNPRLSTGRRDGVLYILCGKRPVIDVYPADGKASNTDEASLAKIWMKNIREALPRSTPVSRMPARPPTPGPSGAPPAPTGAVRPAGGVTPAGGGPSTELSGQTPGASTQPTGEIVPKPEPAPLPTPSKTPRSSALLMVLETMNLVRTLTEQEYLEGRDRMASNLVENLEPFMAEARATGEAAGTPQPTRPTLIETPPGPKPSEPPSTPPSTPPKPVTGGVPTVPRVPTVPSTPPTTPTAPRVPTVPSTPSGGTVTSAPTVPTAAGADTARVPQKQRIKRKFAAAEQPFMALKNAGDPKADEVSGLLKESRGAFTNGDFDTSETKIDQALRLMGVPIPN